MPEFCNGKNILKKTKGDEEKKKRKMKSLKMVLNLLHLDNFQLYSELRENHNSYRPILKANQNMTFPHLW